MADNLVIVESPTKAKTIGRYLGKNYKIVASVGHVRDLPKSRLGVDVEKDFEPKYITIRGKGDIISQLKKDAKGSKHIFLATDPDREGEAISWHLATLLNIAGEDRCRVAFNEVTKNAITAAIKNPRKIDMDLVDAQQARRVLDRIVGYQISPLLWRKVRKGLSAGRVQSVATRLICDRELEIENFISDEYWTIDAKLSKIKHKPTFVAKFYGEKNIRSAKNGNDDKNSVGVKNGNDDKNNIGAKNGNDDKNNIGVKNGNDDKNNIGVKNNNDEKNNKNESYKKTEIKDKEQADAILKDLDKAKFKVEAIRKSEKKKSPSAPFITSTLQQEASRKLNFPAKKTMGVVQRLYEGIEIKGKGAVGLVTYIRTDSTRVSPEAQTQASRVIKEKYGEAYLPKSYRVYKNKNAAQDAHEAIRPTYFDLDPEIIRSSLTFEQYRLYKLIWDRFIASQMENAVYDMVYVDIEASGKLFKAVGSKVKFKGYTAVYREGLDNDEDVPDEDSGYKLPDLTEGEILDLKELIPAQHFTQPPPRYTEATLIRTLEENGIGRPSTYSPTISTILARGYVEKEKKTLLPTELGMTINHIMSDHFPKIVDVTFTADMEKQLDDVEEGQKEWKTVIGEFYQGFQATLKTAEEEIGTFEIPDEVTDTICEKCGRNMVIKNGRYGKFLACPGFPQCQNAKPILEYAGVECPKCGKQIVYRRTKKGKRYVVCEGAPDCDYRSWDIPAGKNCPVCGKFMVKSGWSRNAKAKCSDADCGKSVQEGGAGKRSSKAEQES